MQFNFGLNWETFSEQKMSDHSLEMAIASLQMLLQRNSLDNMSFLDVGCGSGLFSIAANKLNAEKIIGFDINPISVMVSNQNQDKFAPDSPITFIQGSALDSEFINSLDVFDIVYAWGSLHHTGSMWESIRYISQSAKDDGIYVLSIYNKHFTSPIWNFIKYTYNHSHEIGKKLMILFFSIIIYVAKLMVTRRNPLIKERGMDFWHDVIDWVGGYPYEYATPDEVEKFLNSLGFTMILFQLAQVPTGCNEYVFRRSTK